MVSSEKSLPEPSETKKASVHDGSPTLDALIALLSSLNLTQTENEALIDMLSTRVDEQLATPSVTVDIRGPQSSASATPTTLARPVDKVPSTPSQVNTPRASVIRVNSAPANYPPIFREISEGDEAYPTALAHLAEGCALSETNGVYYNVTLARSPPFYFVIRGRHIGVFAGWDITAPKVNKVSGAVYAGCSTLADGENKVRRAIERGEAWQIE